MRWLRLDPATAELDLSSLDDDHRPHAPRRVDRRLQPARHPSPRSRTVAARAHDVGALVYVDAVHHTAHAAPDITAMGADFLVCSPTSSSARTAGRWSADPALLETLRPDKLLPSTDVVPERFELGTLPYELLAGVTAAVDLIASVGSGRHAGASGSSRRPRRSPSTSCGCGPGSRRASPSLGDRLTLHSRAAERTSTLFLTLRDRSPLDVFEHLAKRDVLVPAGTFYAHETFRALGLSVDSGLRIGLAAYNDDSDVDRLLEGLSDVLG